MTVNIKNWQELKKPNSLEVKPGSDPKRRATFVAEPLERGFGLTLGNALRRVLLSSLQGAAITISIALATLPFGLALGLIVALCKRSESIVLRAFATVYTTVFRGVPELLTLYIIYFGIQILVQKIWSGFSIPPFVAGMVALGMHQQRRSQQRHVHHLSVHGKSP